MRTSFLKPLAVVAAVLVAPAISRADWMTQNSGNSVLVAPQASADGVINFAVYQNTGSNWLTTLGVTATQLTNSNKDLTGNIDATAKYVYMYQIVNTKLVDPGKNDLVALNVAVDKASVTGYGSLKGDVFKDAAGNVGGTGNTRLDKGKDSDTSPNPEGFPIDGKPSFAFGAGDPTTSVAIAQNDSSATNALSASYSDLPNGPPDYSPFLRFNFGELGQDQYSSIVFITSNVAPIFYAGILQQGTEYTAGDVSTMNRAPEPGTMALLALGLPLAGYGYRRRLQKRAAAAAAAN